MRPAPHRAVARAAFLAVLFVTALAASVTAHAAPACAKQVVADWYDNGRVDRVYDLHCYEAAIDTLPVDVRDYSSAREDIQRALAAAARGQDDTGGGSGAAPTTPQATPPPPPPPPAPAPPPPPATTTSGTSTSKSTTSPKPTTTTAKPTPAKGGTATVAEAVEPVDTSGPSTVPMPLIVLGGLALLLLAAGSAGYITRRVQSRRSGGDPPATA